MKQQIADSINVLGKFCGKRDINELTKDELKKEYKSFIRKANPLYASKSK